VSQTIRSSLLARVLQWLPLAMRPGLSLPAELRSLGKGLLLEMVEVLW
jgi:hypothetical protein